ncbi:MAG: deaminase [Candidatus Pacearchaeota archaeon]
MVIVGVTGLNAAGKDTFANYLTKKSFYHISLSDILRDIAKKRNIKITRENLIKIGNEIREKYGPSILAQLALEKANKEAFGQHLVISSIRNIYELNYLERQKNFILVAIIADVKTRYERYCKNPHAGFMSFEKFVELEEQEKSDKPEAQQLHLVLERAKVKIINDSTLENFYKKIDRFLQDFIPKLDKRFDWDNYFMSIAKQVATRSNCIKRKVGAVIVKDRRIISTGYNGTPRGIKNCNEGGCPRCYRWEESGKALSECFCSHAEENAIVQAAYHGISTNNAVLYVTFVPCLLCAKMIINAGIKEVYYNASYSLSKDAENLLKQAGVKLVKLK